MDASDIISVLTDVIILCRSVSLRLYAQSDTYSDETWLPIRLQDHGCVYEPGENQT